MNPKTEHKPFTFGKFAQQNTKTFADALLSTMKHKPISFKYYVNPAVI